MCKAKRHLLKCIACRETLLFEAFRLRLSSRIYDRNVSDKTGLSGHFLVVLFVFRTATKQKSQMQKRNTARLFSERQISVRFIFVVSVSLSSLVICGSTNVFNNSCLGLSQSVASMKKSDTLGVSVVMCFCELFTGLRTEILFTGLVNFNPSELLGSRSLPLTPFVLP